MPRILSVILSLIILCLTISSCKQDKSKEKTPAPSGENATVKIIRFEQELFGIDKNNVVPGLQALAKKYPDLYPVFINGILAIHQKPSDYTLYEKEIRELLTNEYVLGLYDSVQLKYPNLRGIEKELTGAFKRYKEEFPKNPVPRVYSIISEFGTGTFTIGKETIGIGLDMFLGPKYMYYPSVGVPNFLLTQLDEPYIVPNAMRVLAKELTREPVDKPTLLAFMIYQGKTLYFTERMLPKKPLHLVMGYSKEQQKWCVDNEAEIWGFFIEKELLYSPRMMEFPRYLNDAPYTYGMPPESPGRVGAWVGWQIVRSYMKNNPDSTLAGLMAQEDAQMIFNRSGYKPKKK